MQIHHSNAEGSGAWVQLSNESSKGLMSSGHLLLVDTRFELPSGMAKHTVLTVDDKLIDSIRIHGGNEPGKSSVVLHMSIIYNINNIASENIY